jgi:hypothetical protein
MNPTSPIESAVGYAAEQREASARDAIGALDALAVDLAEMKASIEAFERGESAVRAQPYGNRFTAAQVTVAKYTAAMEQHELLKKIAGRAEDSA